MNDTITLIGNLGTDPELKATPTGKNVASFSLAVNQRKFDDSSKQWVDVDTSWYTVEAWGRLASHVHQSLKKGDSIVAVGRLRVRKWTKEVRDGDNVETRSGTSVELKAWNVGPDLARSPVSIDRSRGDAVPSDAAKAPDDEHALTDELEPATPF